MQFSLLHSIIPLIPFDNVVEYATTTFNASPITVVSSSQTNDLNSYCRATISLDFKSISRVDIISTPQKGSHINAQRNKSLKIGS